MKIFQKKEFQTNQLATATKAQLTKPTKISPSVGVLSSKKISPKSSSTFATHSKTTFKIIITSIMNRNKAIYITTGTSKLKPYNSNHIKGSGSVFWCNINEVTQNVELAVVILYSLLNYI